MHLFIYVFLYNAFDQDMTGSVKPNRVDKPNYRRPCSGHHNPLCCSAVLSNSRVTTCITNLLLPFPNLLLFFYLRLQHQLLIKMCKHFMLDKEIPKVVKNNGQKCAFSLCFKFDPLSHETPSSMQSVAQKLSVIGKKSTNNIQCQHCCAPLTPPLSSIIFHLCLRPKLQSPCSHFPNKRGVNWRFEEEATPCPMVAANVISAKSNAYNIPLHMQRGPVE